MLPNRICPADIQAMQRGNPVFERAFKIAQSNRSPTMILGLDCCAHLDKKFAAEIIRRSAVVESKRDF